MEIMGKKCVYACLCSFVWVLWVLVCTMNSDWPWFWFTKHCQGDAMNSCVCMCVNACANACVTACKVIHWPRQTKYDMQPHILSTAAQHVNPQTHTTAHTLIHVADTLTHKLCNMKACVYSLSCGQDPRGCLPGSLGLALRDVINQFRARWGQEAGATGELVQ